MKRLLTTVVLTLGLLVLMAPMAVSAASGVTVVGTSGDGEWIGDTWQVSIYPSESKSTTLTLYNSSSDSLEIEVAISPGAMDNGNLTFELDRSTFIISGRSYDDIILTVKANGGTTPGIYATELTIKSEVPLTPSPTPSGSVPMFALFNLTIEDITEGSADILWETSRPTTSELIYWSISEITIENETRTSEHIVSLEELEDNTTYYFKITSRDRYGLKKSVTGEFTTLEAEVIIAPEPEEPEPTIPEPTLPDEPEEPIESEESTEPAEPTEPEEPTKPGKPEEKESEDLVVTKESSWWNWLNVGVSIAFILLVLGVWQWLKRRLKD